MKDGPIGAVAYGATTLFWAMGGRILVRGVVRPAVRGARRAIQDADHRAVRATARWSISYVNAKAMLVEMAYMRLTESYVQETKRVLGRE